jgi:hypothetical protein
MRTIIFKKTFDPAETRYFPILENIKKYLLGWRGSEQIFFSGLDMRKSSSTNSRLYRQPDKTLDILKACV